MHTSTSSSYLPKMSSLQYFKVRFPPQPPKKLEAASSPKLLSCSSTKRLHCALWVGTIYHDIYDMHFFRVRDYFHSQFFLALGNIRLFQVIDNRSFQGIDSAPIQVSGKTSLLLTWMVQSQSHHFFYFETWYFHHRFVILKSFWLSANEITLLIMASMHN